jgi:glycosyltransferase involved in cell wall biosynthesis
VKSAESVGNKNMKQEGGQRILGTYKLVSTPQKPVVSVITVVYNSEKLLERTIENILSQTYLNIELVIVDGGSKDGTLDIIRKYNDQISYWVSEKDKGLYDAMDKGLQLASGDYVWYINSGDLIFDANTTEKIFAKYPTDADIYYGDTLYVDGNYEPIGLRNDITNKKLPTQLSVDSFKYGMVICHQAFIMKRILAARYDLQYKFVSDYDWVIACTKKSTSFVHTHQTLAKFLTEGFSTKHRKASVKEKYKVLIKHWGFVTGNINYLTNACKATLSFLKRKKYVKEYGIQ